LKICCILQDYHDNERNRPCFTTQHQTCKTSVQDQDQDRFFWSQTGLVLRPRVSDQITDSL